MVRCTHLCDHVVNEPVLIPDSQLLILLLVALRLVHFLKDLKEPPVVALQNGILCAAQYTTLSGFAELTEGSLYTSWKNCRKSPLKTNSHLLFIVLYSVHLSTPHMPKDWNQAQPYVQLSCVTPSQR